MIPLFLKNKQSAEKTIKALHLFSSFSGLRPNLSTCSFAETGSLEEVDMAVCVMTSVNLKNDTANILGTHFSYNMFIKKEFFKTNSKDSKYFKLIESEKSHD